MFTFGFGYEYFISRNTFLQLIHLLYLVFIEKIIFAIIVATVLMD